MRLGGLEPSVRGIFGGNLLLVVCCAFYLAWWLLAFKPAGAVKGMRTGWLLIPAFVAGLAAVILTLQGIGAVTMRARLFPAGWILWGGAAGYLALLAVTRLLFKRPVTTELLLIVGWAMLALAEIDALYGAGRFSYRASLLSVALTGAAAVVCLVCYVLYYRLDGRAGYIDGMVPLLLAAAVMAGLSIGIAA